MTNRYPKLIATVFISLFISTLAVAQIPNAGFETWNSVGFPSYLDPAGWGTLNGSTNIIGIKTIERAGAPDVHSGTYALKASTKYISFANQTAPGITATGTINTNTQAIEGGFPYNQRPSQLRGWYKYAPVNGDTAVVEVSLFKWNSTTHQTILVGEGKMNNPAAVSSYTQFSIPITYYTADIPDTGRIILFSSASFTPQDGSVAFYDDLAFFNCNVSATASSTPATCTAADGTVTVQFNTANSQGITYNWSNGGTTASLSAVASGNYSVTATDGDGCSASATVVVTANTLLLNASATSTPSSCSANTGSATASSLNGSSPFSYAWSNAGNTATISNIGAGAYQVTITDANGCAGTASTTVTTPNGPTATTAPTDADCFGAATGAVNVTVSGGATPYGFIWSNSANTEDLTNVVAGSYSVTITDINGCPFVVSATVNQPSALVTTVSATDASSSTATDGTITTSASGGTPPYTYAWTNSAIASSLGNLAAGVYCVTVSDFNACTTSGCDTVSAPSAITNISLGNVFMFPNPAADVLNIALDITSAYSLQIFSVEGKLMLEQSLAQNQNIISVRDLISGLYIVSIRDTKSGATVRKKLQIQR